MQLQWNKLGYYEDASTGQKVNPQTGSFDPNQSYQGAGNALNGSSPGMGLVNYTPPSAPTPAAPPPTQTQQVPDSPSSSFNIPSMDTGGGAMPSMPSMPALPTPATPSSSQAMAGLQAASPDMTPAASFQMSGPEGLRQGIGTRNPPSMLSGLKVLSY